MGVFEFIKQKKEEHNKARLKNASDNIKESEKQLMKLKKQNNLFQKEKKLKESVKFQREEIFKNEHPFLSKAKDKLKQAKDNRKKGKTMGLLGGTGKSQSIFTSSGLSSKPNPIFTGGFNSSKSPFVGNSSAPYWLKSNQSTSRRRKVHRRKHRR
jgi:hypothetical protein